MASDPIDLSALESYLLTPAQLSSIITLEDFRQLFPPSLRNSPKVSNLYQSAVTQRAKDLVHISSNIAAEEKRRNDLLDQASFPAPTVQSTDMRVQRELDLDRLVAAGGNYRGAGPSGGGAKTRSLKAVLPAMEDACRTLKAEIELLDAQERDLMEKLRTRVGDLSDLRYGKLPQEPGGGQVADEAAEALRELTRKMIEAGSSTG